jgi:hypothetical protein
MTLVSGVRLVQSADALLERSARSFTHAAVPSASTSFGSDAPPRLEDLVRAATDVVDARRDHGAGVALIRAQREQDRALLDVVA